LKLTKFISIFLLIIITRVADIVFTYQYTPDLKNEANPLVVHLGFGWKEIIIIQLVAIIYIGYLLYGHIYNRNDINPKIKNLSFNYFALQQCYGDKFTDTSKKWNILIDYPRNSQRIKYIMGWVLPMATIIIGFELVLLHLSLRNSQIFRYYYWIILPAFYISIVFIFFLLYYVYMRIKYMQYKQ